MAKDAELDRLKAVQDLAFNRKQSAYDEQEAAWNRRKAAGDIMHAAYADKQSAYDRQQSSWENLQRLRDSKGPQIESLNRQQETAYQNMLSSFGDASSAHDRRDGAAAKSYAERGHSYKAEAKGYVETRRRLVDELRAAGDAHKALAPVFQAAKARFDNAKQEHNTAKATHERTQMTFKAAKADFDRATRAFRDRLAVVKQQNGKKIEDKRDIARKAGVPYQYLDKVWVSKDSNGNTNIYFGGAGTPNGPGHGHYVVDKTDKVTYKRDPLDQHGAQNFTDSQRDYTELIGAEAASGEFGFNCQFRGFDAYVESNTNREGRAKIDIYYGPHGPLGPGHHHAVAYRENPYEFVSDEMR